jgi:hypothetical protein
MQTGASVLVRRPGRWAVLSVIVAAGVFAGPTSALAGQQSSNQATDYRLSWQAASGDHTGAYAQSPPPYVPRHRYYR